MYPAVLKSPVIHPCKNIIIIKCDPPGIKSLEERVDFNGQL
jgi:hypothetical protein